jgi:hypothetical protein
MSNEARYSPKARDLLLQYLTEKFGKRVDATEEYRPFTAAIGLNLNDVYVLHSEGEIYVSSKHWVRIGRMADPDVLERLVSFVEDLIDSEKKCGM